jgi:hypothetical protein
MGFDKERKSTGDRVVSKVGAGSFAVAGAHEAREGLCGVESEGLFEHWSISQYRVCFFLSF